MNLVDRYKGALLGLATGDALGTAVEFKPRGSFAPATTMMGGGAFGLRPGQWTDDTSMAMCLAQSLVEHGFDPLDQMTRYVRWWREGYWSSTGTCFDIGNTTSQALATFERTGEPFAGSTSANMAGNGSLMRLAPVPLRFANDPPIAVHYAAENSRTTHGAVDAIDACRYFAGLIVGALRGEDKSTILSAAYAPPGVNWNADPLSQNIAAIAAGSFKTKGASEIRATGYVLHTLEAALWAFFHTDNFRDGALLAVNLGDDADTTGAVYGQIAGAYYGFRALPADWLTTLHRANEISELATSLLFSAQVN